MTFLETISALPGALVYVAREARKAWLRYWYLAHGWRNPDNAPF